MVTSKESPPQTRAQEYRIARNSAIVLVVIATLSALQVYTNFKGAGFGGPGGVMFAALSFTCAILGVVYVRRALRLRGA